MLKEYLAALWMHWWPLMSCAAFTFLSIAIGIGSQHPRLEKWLKAWEWKLTLCLAAVFFFLSGYYAWKDEYMKAQSTSVYVEPHIGPAYLDANGAPLFMSLGNHLDAKFLFTRTGQDIASNLQTVGMIYVEQDASLQTQKKLASDVIAKLNAVTTDASRNGSEGTTLGYSTDTSTAFTTPNPDLTPLLDRGLLAELWSGSKFELFLSAARYEDSAGKEYESHFCEFLLPLNQNSPERGKPLPSEVKNLPLSFSTCGTFNGVVKK